MLTGTILIIDDAPAVVESLMKALSTFGIRGERVLVAHDAASARELVNQHAPELIFMDVNLGDDSGDRLAIEFLEEDPTRRIVMITGLDLGDDRVRAAVSAGAYEVLPKPVRLARIRELLELVASEAKGLRRV